MTRKDYIAIASAIKSARCSYQFGAEQSAANVATYNNCVDNCVAYVSDALARDNPRFDRARFTVACGVQA
jgi:hypothetical protein